MIEAVTKALKERVERLKRARSQSDEDLPERLEALAARLRKKYDLSRPVTKQEWDEACGDTSEELGF